MNEIILRCCSPFNPETCSNLICSAISVWIEKTVQKWENVQNHCENQGIDFWYEWNNDYMLLPIQRWNMF